jgi:hypothetical protein
MVSLFSEQNIFGLLWNAGISQHSYKHFIGKQFNFIGKTQKLNIFRCRARTSFMWCVLGIMFVQIYKYICAQHIHVTCPPRQRTKPSEKQLHCNYFASSVDDPPHHCPPFLDYEQLSAPPGREQQPPPHHCSPFLDYRLSAPSGQEQQQLPPRHCSPFLD